MPVFAWLATLPERPASSAMCGGPAAAAGKVKYGCGEGLRQVLTVENPGRGVARPVRQMYKSCPSRPAGTVAPTSVEEVHAERERERERERDLINEGKRERERGGGGGVFVCDSKRKRERERGLY